jgi:hypothetical protein
MKQDLTNHVAAVLSGKSISSEARLAGVAKTTLLRLVIKHPDYASAKAAGLLHSPGLPGLIPVSDETLRAAIDDVANGMTALESAHKHGLASATVTKAFHREYPDRKLVKGGVGVKRDAATKLAQAQATVERCRKALEKAEVELEALLRA